MRVFQIAPLLVLSLLAPCFSAPVEQPADKPLQRVKRTKEIMYGNHQNSARTKKSGPIIEDPQEQTLAEGVGAADDVDDLVNEVTNELPEESISEEENAIEKAEEVESEVVVHEEDDLALLQGHKEEDALENLKAGEEVKSKEEEEEKVEDELLPFGKQVEDDTKIKEAVKEDALPNGDIAQTLMKEETEIDHPLAPEGKGEGANWYDYLNFDGYLPPYAMDTDRTKRSAKANLPLTAENMMPDTPQRSKRDLTDDELREWLEEEAGIPSAQEYPEEYEDEEDAQETLIERLLEGSPEEEWGQEPFDVEEEEDVYYPGEVDPNAEARAKLAMLRYIYDKLPEDLPEPEYEGPYETEVPLAEFQERQEVNYEPVVYRGVPGIFIPIQSQRPIPDVIKRGSDFYPYNYESSPSSRWEAFMPSHNAMKRNADAYERLYQMARALRRYDDDWL